MRRRILAMGCGFAIFLAASGATAQTAKTASPLPPNPGDWVCRDPGPSEEQIRALCDGPRGDAHNLGMPASLFDLPAKNRFDEKFQSFLKNFQYRKLKWLRDKTWRLSGPLAYTNKGASPQNFGVHPAVAVAYALSRALSVGGILGFPVVFHPSLTQVSLEASLVFELNL